MQLDCMRNYSPSSPSTSLRDAKPKITQKCTLPLNPEHRGVTGKVHQVTWKKPYFTPHTRAMITWYIQWYILIQLWLIQGQLCQYLVLELLWVGLQLCDLIYMTYHYTRCTGWPKKKKSPSEISITPPKINIFVYVHIYLLRVMAVSC